MDKQSPIHEKLNKIEENKEKFIDSIKDNLNLIYVGIMILIQVLLALFKFEGGELKPNFPTTQFGWIIWIAQIVISTFMGVMILNAFRRQGIHNGHKHIQDTYDAYKKALAKPIKDKKPRSQKQYMAGAATKDTFKKSITFIGITIFANSIPPIITANWGAVIPLIVSIILAIAFGIKAMLDAEYFVETELVTWYQLEINKIEKSKEEENGRRIQGSMCRIRQRNPNRIQQKKKCRTGSAIKSIIKSNQRFTRATTSRLFNKSILWA